MSSFILASLRIDGQRPPSMIYVNIDPALIAAAAEGMRGSSAGTGSILANPFLQPGQVVESPSTNWGWTQGLGIPVRVWLPGKGTSQLSTSDYLNKSASDGSNTFGAELFSAEAKHVDGATVVYLNDGTSRYTLVVYKLQQDLWGNPEQLQNAVLSLEAAIKPMLFGELLPETCFQQFFTQPLDPMDNAIGFQQTQHADGTPLNGTRCYQRHAVGRYCFFMLFESDDKALIEDGTFTAFFSQLQLPDDTHDLEPGN